MRASHIEFIIENFITSNATAIVFDGNWGIGKTYAIETFLTDKKCRKEIYDNCHFHYVSLFGYKDIEILHKELYKKFHPCKSKSVKFLSYISLAVSLKHTNIGINSSEIRKDIEENQINKSLAKDYFDNIIIFDDIERVASSTDGFIQLLGYFNRLIKEGIRIICICNSDEMTDEIRNTYLKFKEKVFDRAYTINEDNIDIIKAIFGETFNYLDETAIRFFESNLRFCKKSKLFIDEVRDQLTNHEGINYRTVCLICILIIKEVFTLELSKPLREKQEKKRKDEDSDIFQIDYMIENDNTDELSIQAITETLRKQQVVPNTSMIKGLYKYFKYYDDSYFHQKGTQSTLLNKSIFYYSDEERKLAIRNVLQSIYNNFNKFSSTQIGNALNDILRYDDNNILTDKDYRELSKFLFSSNDKVKIDELVESFDQNLFLNPTGNQKKFIEELNNESKRIENQQLTDFFTSLNIEKYNGELTQWILKFEGKNENLDDGISNLLKTNGFFIPDLSKTISYNVWDYCHDICSFITRVNNNLKSDLITSLDRQIMKNPNSKCAKERVDALKVYKLHTK